MDRERIGAIGLCGAGGFAVTAAQVDKRIKAVATASMYDISRADHYGWKDSMTKDEYDAMLERLGEQRWKDFEKGEPEYLPSFPPDATTAVPEELDAISAEFSGILCHGTRPPSPCPGRIHHHQPPFIHQLFR